MLQSSSSNGILRNNACEALKLACSERGTRRVFPFICKATAIASLGFVGYCGWHFGAGGSSYEVVEFTEFYSHF